MCGVWLDIQIVYSSVPGLYQPMSPRVSIGFGMRRWLTIRWRTTTSAPSMAASVPALSPTFHSKTTLFGAFSWSCGAPAAIAFSASTTAGSGSQSTSIASSASCACSGVSATTAATPSPVHLTLSVASDAGRVDVVLDAALPPAGQAIGSGLYGMSAPTKTATTPGIALAALVSIERMFACAYGLRRMAMWVIDWQLDVVEVVAVAGDEARVLDALDAAARTDVDGHLGHRSPSPYAVPAPAAAPSRMASAACTDRRDDVLVAGAAADVALDARGGSPRRSGRGRGRAGRPRP